MTTFERQLEEQLIQRLAALKYEYRPDIRDRAGLEKNFRRKFEDLNRVHLTDAEFQRLLDEIVTPDVFAASKLLRESNTFTRDDGTPLNYTLVNLKDWCKNDFEVVNQLRMSTDYSSHRYDVVLLINGIPVVQVELKTLGLNPRRAMEQIVGYKNDPGNGYTKTLLCFLQFFVVSNRDHTYFFANNNARHFTFDADERYLPIYKWADPDNRKYRIAHSWARSGGSRNRTSPAVHRPVRFIIILGRPQNDDTSGVKPPPPLKLGCPHSRVRDPEQRIRDAYVVSKPKPALKHYDGRRL